MLLIWMYEHNPPSVKASGLHQLSQGSKRQESQQGIQCSFAPDAKSQRTECMQMEPVITFPTWYPDAQ